MANEEHLARLRAGVDAWRAWREEHPDITPDLSEADLSRANLGGANFRRVNLGGANLSRADLRRANLRRANLRGANLSRANLWKANLRRANFGKAILDKSDFREAYLFEADLSGASLGAANLRGANLVKADLSKANFSGADLGAAILIKTNLKDANLTGCRVYGISAWDVKLEGATQRDLVIATGDQPEITVDNLEVAQFIYLLLHNENIRHVIDTITSKVVLILGRFTLDRKAVLDSLRKELRKRDYLPVLFDFPPSESRNITETVSLLAHMARFVVADITEARSIPQELSVIVPDLPSVPVQPLLQEGAGEYGMFEHFRRFPWVLEAYCYPSTEHLIATLGERVIAPAEAKVRELRG